MGQYRFSGMALVLRTAAVLGLAVGSTHAYADAPAATPAAAPADCKTAFVIFRSAADALLDAALHSQDDYNALRTARYAPALSTAIAACKGQAEIRQAVYNVDFKLKSYESTRDLAIQMLQERPPAPTD